MNEGDAIGIFWVYYYFVVPMTMHCKMVIIPDRAFVDSELFMECVKRHKIVLLYVKSLARLLAETIRS